MRNFLGRFTIVFVPPEGYPKVKRVKGRIQDMENVLESKRADFNYYKDAIIATNSKIDGLSKNKHIRKRDVYGSFYIIGNNASNDDFCSLTGEQIEHYKNLFSE